MCYGLYVVYIYIYTFLLFHTFVDVNFLERKKSKRYEKTWPNFGLNGIFFAHYKVIREIPCKNLKIIFTHLHLYCSKNVQFFLLFVRGEGKTGRWQVLYLQRIAFINGMMDGWMEENKNVSIGQAKNYTTI